CHVEHEGPDHLMKVSDSRCVQCHRNLQVKNGAPHYETVVKSFVGDHPEFKPLRKPRDPGTIALNHEVHMRAGIRGPHGGVQLQCNDCHRPAADVNQPWTYSESTIADAAGNSAPEMTKSDDAHLVPTALDQLPPSAGRAHMGPIKYSSQCAACHQLQFDERMPDLVPHGKPEVIHDFVEQKYKQYVTAHPNVWRETPVAIRRIPGVQPPPPAHSAAEWVSIQTQQAEMLMWRKNCKL